MSLELTHVHSASCGCRNEKGLPLFVEAPTAATQKALDYCEKNLRGALEDLSTLVRIPSVSLEGFDANALQLSAEAVAELLSASGLEKGEVMQFGDVHPYVYAEWMHKPGAPTLLLYAHHDVQPPGEEAKWRSHPFEPKESGGRLYGRGAADDKAGILAHAAAIAAFLKTSGELPVNVKVIIEGEEETGSTHLAEFTRRYRDRLSADAMILTDCANIETGIPSITTALRGLVAIDIEVEALAHSVHSGLWGGVLATPRVLCTKSLPAHWKKATGTPRSLLAVEQAFPSCSPCLKNSAAFLLSLWALKTLTQTRTPKTRVLNSPTFAKPSWAKFTCSQTWPNTSALECVNRSERRFEPWRSRIGRLATR